MYTIDVRYIDQAKDNELVHQGDILLSRSRLVGVCGLVTDKEEGFSFGSYILRIRMKKDVEVSPEYIVSFLNSDLGQAQIRLLETGSFGKNINTRQVKEIRIALPKDLDELPSITLEIRNTGKNLNNIRHEAQNLWLNSRKKFVDILLR